MRATGLPDTELGIGRRTGAGRRAGNFAALLLGRADGLVGVTILGFFTLHVIVTIQADCSQEPEDIVVREHRSLTLNHAPDRNVSLAVGAHRVKSSGNKKLPQAGKRLQRARII